MDSILFFVARVLSLLVFMVTLAIILLFVFVLMTWYEHRQTQKNCKPELLSCRDISVRYPRVQPVNTFKKPAFPRGYLLDAPPVRPAFLYSPPKGLKSVPFKNYQTGNFKRPSKTWTEVFASRNTHSRIGGPPLKIVKPFDWAHHIRKARQHNVNPFSRMPKPSKGQGFVTATGARPTYLAGQNLWPY